MTFRISFGIAMMLSSEKNFWPVILMLSHITVTKLRWKCLIVKKNLLPNDLSAFLHLKDYIIRNSLGEQYHFLLFFFAFLLDKNLFNEFKNSFYVQYHKTPDALESCLPFI